jgi:hypothetical protein
LVFFFGPGITYKDPEKYQTEKSLVTAIVAAQKGGKKFSKTGNSFKPRGAGRGFNNRWGRGSMNRGGKQSFGSNHNGQKPRWGKTGRGKPQGKRQPGSNDHKD